MVAVHTYLHGVIFFVMLTLILVRRETFPTQVGLGAVGVVTEVTIKCVPRHELLESTSVMTRAEVKAKHHSLLQHNKHVR